MNEGALVVWEKWRGGRREVVSRVLFAEVRGLGKKEMRAVLSVVEWELGGGKTVVDGH